MSSTEEFQTLRLEPPSLASEFLRILKEGGIEAFKKLMKEMDLPSGDREPLLAGDPMEREARVSLETIKEDDYVTIPIAEKDLVETLEKEQSEVKSSEEPEKQSPEESEAMTGTRILLALEPVILLLHQISIHGSDKIPKKILEDENTRKLVEDFEKKGEIVFEGSHPNARHIMKALADNMCAYERHLEPLLEECNRLNLVIKAPKYLADLQKDCIVEEPKRVSRTEEEYLKIINDEKAETNSKIEALRELCDKKGEFVESAYLKVIVTMAKEKRSINGRGVGEAWKACPALAERYLLDKKMPITSMNWFLLAAVNPEIECFKKIFEETRIREFPFAAMKFLWQHGRMDHLKLFYLALDVKIPRHFMEDIMCEDIEIWSLFMGKSEDSILSFVGFVDDEEMDDYLKMVRGSLISSPASKSMAEKFLIDLFSDRPEDPEPIGKLILDFQHVFDRKEALILADYLYPDLVSYLK